MTTQRVTIELPEPVFRQLARIAQATQQSVEVLAAQSVVSNLPPSVENAPLELQPELLKMQTFSIEELLAIAGYKTLVPTNLEKASNLAVANLYWYFYVRDESEEETEQNVKTT
ncbi:MAG: hypothetical protein RIB93_17765 [Coleofasciculus sp. D1-CHI-01]|uniref:hypothetical protein n=1 Tax=Coleofasciculus sp. D1-CHI-01 TaxID=3068482 RepID=UPI0032F27A32